MKFIFMHSLHKNKFYILHIFVHSLRIKYIIYALIFTSNIALLYLSNLQISISKGLRMINFLDFAKFNVDTRV